MNAYQTPMLPLVDYALLDKEKFSQFLELLTKVLKEEKIVQIPESLVAHLCAYWSSITALHRFNLSNNKKPCGRKSNQGEKRNGR